MGVCGLHQMAQQAMAVLLWERRHLTLIMRTKSIMFLLSSIISSHILEKQKSGEAANF